MADKKTPKEASDLFHKIMKVSVTKGLVTKPKKEVKSKSKLESGNGTERNG